MPIRTGPGVLETATTPPSSGPMNLMLTLSPQILTPQLPVKLAPMLNQEHLNSPNMDLASPPEPTALQMLLREVQGPIYYDQHGQIQGERWTFVYHPFTTTDLLNWKHHTLSFTEKPQALIDLVQPIIQTHKPTWTDCQQLLLILFNTEERCFITLAVLKWLEDRA
jgi:hypothetical protein